MSNDFNSYQNFNNPFAPKDPFINRDARHLARLSLLAGAGVLGFVCMQYVISIILVATGLYDVGFALECVINILASIFGVYVPFLIVHHFYSPSDKELCFKLNLPNSKKSFGYALRAGTMICFIGNYITSGFAGFVSTYDIEFSSIDVQLPSNIGEFLLYTLQVAIVPALVEEVAIRGIVMPPLRKYGDRFAIIMSAIIFALMHNNMMQVPFAFVAGIVLGYFAISTGSVWTAVAIHAANNFISILSAVAAETFVGPFLFYALMILILVVGVYSAKQFLKEEHLGLGLTFTPKSERKFLLAAFLVFLFISFVYSSYSVETSGTYILTALLLAFCLRRYLKANKRQLNPVPSSSLNLKMKVALYCATPTVVFGTVLLATETLKSITVTSSNGYFFLYGALLAMLASVLYMIYKILNSKVLDNKIIYKRTLVVLFAVFIFSMIRSFLSSLLMY